MAEPLSLNAHRILRALAAEPSRARTRNELAATSGVPARRLDHTLRHLRDEGILATTVRGSVPNAQLVYSMTAAARSVVDEHGLAR